MSTQESGYNQKPSRATIMRRRVIAVGVAGLLAGGVIKGATEVISPASADGGNIPEETYTFKDRAQYPGDSLDDAANRISVESGAPVDVVRENLHEVSYPNDGINTDPDDPVFTYDPATGRGEPVEAYLPKSTVTLPPTNGQIQP